MWLLIAILALGDLVVLGLWLRERRRHRKSRRALAYWRRDRGGLTRVPLDSVEHDMAVALQTLREDARRRASGNGIRIRLAPPGDVA